MVFFFFSASSFAQLNMTFLGHLTYSSSLASLWGYAANGKEYALVGAYGGLSIVDVTTPTTPTEVQFVATNNSQWHEIKTWSHYAYVVNESGGGILIVDLNNLPGSVTYVNFTGGSLNLHTGHTVEIDEQTHARLDAIKERTRKELQDINRGGQALNLYADAYKPREKN